MLNELKRIDLDGADLEQLVSMAAFARNLQAEYNHRNVPIPPWLDNKSRDLTREITRRSQDELQRQYSELLAQEASLMTPAEKRDLVAKKKAALEAQLGLTAAAPSTSGS